MPIFCCFCHSYFLVNKHKTTEMGIYLITFIKINVLYLNFISGFIILSDKHRKKFSWINIVKVSEQTKEVGRQHLEWIRRNKLTHWQIWMKSWAGTYLRMRSLTIILIAIQDPASSCPDPPGGAGTGAGTPWCPHHWSDPRHGWIFFHMRRVGGRILRIFG